jgi:hypothetical protein
MVRMPRNFSFVVASLLVVALFGCGKKPSEERPLIEYADLPLLRETKHRELRDELSRLESEGGTPAQLMAAQQEVSVSDDHNFAVALRAALPEELRDEAFAELGEIYPLGAFEFDEGALAKATKVRERYNDARVAVRQGLTRPDCCFAHQHSHGLCADNWYVVAVQVACRLEALAIAELLAENQPEQSIEGMEAMFRMIGYLAAENNLEARSEAGRLRRDALRVVEAVAAHPNVSRTTLKQFLTILTYQLNDWPADRDAWIGERAAGSHAFEMVRDGRVLSLLSKEEVAQIKENGLYDALRTSTLDRYDDDELLYLRSMATMIESCDQVYHQREPVLFDLKKTLTDRRGLTDEPIVTVRFLLDGFEGGHKLQAQDRALCEAWAIAISLAIGVAPPDYPISPVTGRPYRIVRQDGRIVMWGIGDDLFEPITVPALVDPESS